MKLIESPWLYLTRKIPVGYIIGSGLSEQLVWGKRVFSFFAMATVHILHAQPAKNVIVLFMYINAITAGLLGSENVWPVWKPKNEHISEVETASVASSRANEYRQDYVIELHWPWNYES